MSRPAPDAAILDATKANSPLSVAAAHSALLLMDYQNLIVGMIGATGQQAVHTAAAARDWALDVGMPVYHCVVRVSGDNSTPRPIAKIADRWSTYEATVAKNPAVAEVSSELAPKDAAREKIVSRLPGHVSALRSDGLLAELRANGVTSLIVAGLSTSGCTLSTVRGGTDEDFIVTVIKDACADPLPELHELLMKHTFPPTAHVVSLKDLQDAWAPKS